MPLRLFGLFLACMLCLAAPCPAQQNTAPSPIKTFVAQPAMLPVVLTGFTRARAQMRLASEVTGRCLKVWADVGQTIGPNGLFAKLDPTFVQLELKGNRIEQSRLKSRVAFLNKEVERYRKLVQNKSEAAIKLERLEQDLEQARHQYLAVVNQGKTLAERLARYEIKAPAGWQVIERQVEPGQWVAAGTPLVRLGDFRSLLVPLSLAPEEYQSLMSLAQPLSLLVPDQGGRVPAVIERVNPAFDPATRKINVDLAINGGLKQMRGGVRVQLTLQTPDSSGAVLVPAGALEERYQEYWLTREQGQAVRVVVLGPGPAGTKRVTSPQIKAGQRFRLPE